ncbi:hypothetical protein RDV78_07035 [Bacillota bacterium LX-D]|nr:hypothetical protein [Bacillota bacterium LX-D]
MDHLIYLEKTILDVENEINQCLSPYRQEITLLSLLPGVSLGNNKSVGKKSKQTTPGGKTLKEVLCECA